MNLPLDRSIINALLGFRQKRGQRENQFCHVYHDSERNSLVASDGKRLMIVRLPISLEEGPCFVDEKALRTGYLVKSDFDGKFPDYFALMPSKSGADDFCLLSVPEWLKNYSRSPSRKEIWMRLDFDQGTLSVNGPGVLFRLDLLDALHGQKVQVRHIKHTLLIEQDSSDPIWTGMIVTMGFKQGQ